MVWSTTPRGREGATVDDNGYECNMNLVVECKGVYMHVRFVAHNNVDY